MSAAGCRRCRRATRPSRAATGLLASLSAALPGSCLAQESSSVLVSLLIGPVCRGALQRGGRRSGDRQGRQVPIEADELQLREDPDQPSRQARRPTVRPFTAKQALELLTGHPPPGPKAPVESHE